MNNISSNTLKLNSEKSYLLGLLIGGGILKSNNIQIVLPYNKWGNLKINPSRGGDIAEDILKRIKPLWKLHYKVDISYKIGTDWKINFSEISQELLDDLTALNLESGGEFRETASISKLKPLLLTNKDWAKKFIAGIIDTVGSLAVSHRRFTSDFQIVSLEFKGKNFDLVCDICELLSYINCPPDQVLWNHPNQHSGLDIYYKSWKKGFKIRTLLDDYVLKGSFVSQAKQISANENQKIQKNTNKTSVNKRSNISGRTCLHIDEGSSWIPSNIRNLHFIHFSHVALVLGATSFQSPIDAETPFEKYISPFTILTKGSISEIKEIIKNEDYLNKTEFAYKKFEVSKLVDDFQRDKEKLLFGNSVRDGFPLRYILQGVAYILATEHGGKIKGKRVLGSYVDALKDLSSKVSSITIGIPNKGTCIFIKGQEHGALVGYINDEFNKTLIEKEGVRLSIKNPNFNDCIKL